MPRTSKWAGSDGLWRYCADLRRAGISYPKIYVRLNSPESKKRFGLEEVPSPDTIRYQLKRLGLLEQAIPRSALMPEDLTNHRRGLTFLARALRSQVVEPDLSPRQRIGRATEAWTGFDQGPIYDPNPEGSAEDEVYDEWSEDIADPREISHFEYLVEHLESTPRGRDVSKAISSVFERAAELNNSTSALWKVVYAATQSKTPDDTDDSEVRRTARTVFFSLYPSNQKSKRKRSPHSRGLKTGPDKATKQVTDSLREGNEHLAFIASRKAAMSSVKQLRRALMPADLVLRLVQEGACQICAFDSKLSGRHPDPE